MLCKRFKQMQDQLQQDEKAGNEEQKYDENEGKNAMIQASMR